IKYLSSKDCSGSNLQCGTLKPLLLCPLSLDTEWKAHALQNDSGCGLLVSGTPEGSRKIPVSYAGCYVFEWDHNYFILVGLEGIDTLLRCPVDLPALDGPSSSVCLAVPSQDRLPCASLPISQGDCEARGCCYDPRDRVKPCYFGNTVTAHCTPSDGQFSIAVSRDVTLPPVALGSVQLASGHSTGCVPVLTNNAFVVYQFPLSACGTTFRMNADQAIYENESVASRDVKTGSLGSVTRDSTLSGSSVPLSVQVFALPPLPAVSLPGPLSLELRVASGRRGSRLSEQGSGSCQLAAFMTLPPCLQSSLFRMALIDQTSDPQRGFLHLPSSSACPSCLWWSCLLSKLVLKTGSLECMRMIKWVRKISEEERPACFISARLLSTFHFP
uniref:Zona pellucida sperm-binding protein 4 n=1 Tax=Junco hyemalis TaxID=40217 RepID=A0A8C5NTH5_JUNHY